MVVSEPACDGEVTVEDAQSPHRGLIIVFMLKVTSLACFAEETTSTEVVGTIGARQLILLLGQGAQRPEGGVVGWW